MAQSDSELIKRTLEGDENAFGFLVDKYKGAVHALAYRKIGDFHIAEDITQDTFLKAYQKLSTLKHYAHFPGWLYVIAARCCVSWFRKNQHPTQFLDQVDAAEIEGSAQTKYANDRLRKEVRDALESLPEGDRTVLTLHYLGGMTYEEISSFIGTSTGAIKNRLYHARHHLKEEMIKMIHQTWGTFQLPPTLTQQLIENLYRLKPTATPNGKPLAPWVTAITLGVATLLVAVGMFATSQFQHPYSLSVSTPVEMVELAETPIVAPPLQKPRLPNHFDGDKSLASALAAGEEDTTQIENPRGSISGQVIYADSNKPAANMPIRAVGMELGMEKEPITHTGTDGKYTLKDLIVGPYVVMVGDTWEWHETFAWRAPAQEGIHVKADNVYTGVDFLLTPGAFVEGQITDGDTGQPVAGIQIQIYDATHPPTQGMGHWLKTDTNGRYRFRVAPGQVGISAAPSNTGSEYYFKYPEGQYSGAVAEGETIPDIDFVCYRGYTIHGTVQTADNEPVVGASVRLAMDTGFSRYTQTDKRGQFRLNGVSSSINEIIVDAAHALLHGQGAWSKGQTDPVVITVAQQITATIVGHVIDESGKPIAHAGIGLSWEEGYGGHTTTSPITETDLEGNFTLGPKFHGEWLEIGKVYQVYAKAANYGKTFSEWFTLQKGAKSVPDLVLPKAEYFIAGQVVDWQGQPIGGASVFAGGPHTGANSHTDSEGKFRLKNIADNRVRVYAWHEAYPPSNDKAQFEANREDLQLVLPPNRPMLTDNEGNTIDFDPFPHPLEGKPVPELKVDRWLNTEPIAIESLQDRIVVLSFWSSFVNSEDCAVWFSALNRIHDQYSDKGVIVIGVHTSANLEHHASIQGAIDQEQIRYPVGIATKDSQDKFGATFKDYSVGSIPTILFVDKAGKMRSLFLIGQSLETKVLALLKE